MTPPTAASPASPLETSSQSLLAKVVARNFIENFSKSTLPCFARLSEEEFTRQAHNFYGSLCSKKFAGCRVDGCGKDHFVHSHLSYPNVVVKKMTKASAEIQVRAATIIRLATLHNRLTTIHVPQNLYHPLPSTHPDSSRFVYFFEEKLPLHLTDFGHMEFWIHLSIHYYSSDCQKTFKSNLEILITQIMTLITSTGLWEVSYRNFPEIALDGSRICIVDFDHLATKGLARLPAIYQGLLDLSKLLSLIPELKQIVQEQIQTLFTKTFSDTFNHVYDTPQQLLEAYHKGHAMKSALLKFDCKPLVDVQRILESRDELFHALVKRMKKLANHICEKMIIRMNAEYGPELSLLEQRCCQLTTKKHIHNTLHYLIQKKILISYYSIRQEDDSTLITMYF